MFPSKSFAWTWLFAAALILAWGCAEVLNPIGGKPAEGPVPRGYTRARIQVQLPSAKLSGMAVQATNDLRNQTFPAKMRLTVTGLDIASPIEPSGDYLNPIPLATQTATVSMLVPLGRNLIITAEGLTLDGQTIASAVVKGVFDAVIDQGTTVAFANRLTTPVAEVMAAILAKQTLGPDEQRRSRNLMLSFDTAPLQQFVLQQMLLGTGNLSTDLLTLNSGQLPKHPGLINTAAISKHLWERAAVPPNANFLIDDQGRGSFLTPGRVKGTISGVRAGSQVTVLCDDPVSKPLVVDGSSAFDLGGVQPGRWRVHAHASGYRATISHFTGPGPAPAFYAASDVPAGGERLDLDFAFEPIPPVVARVEPARGPFSPALTNPAYITLHGQDFGSAQNDAVIVFRRTGSGSSLAANLVESWADDRIRVAVPTLSTGDYTVRVDKPTVVPGQFVVGTTTGTYAAGTWRKLFAGPLLPFTQGNPLTALNRRLGVAWSDDLHVGSFLFAGWDSILLGYQPTVISLGQGAVAPAQSFNEANTATPAGAAWALHPDGRSLYVWAESNRLKARAFSISGSPLGAAYTLDPGGITPVACHPEGLAFDRSGTLHLTFSASPGVYHQRWRIDGLGMAVVLGAPVRCDQAQSLVGTQDPPRLRLGVKGHLGLSWIDRRSGIADHYFRVVAPDGSFAYDEQRQIRPIVDFAVDSQGAVAFYTFANTGDKKLVRHGPSGSETGAIDVGSYTYTNSQNYGHSKVLRLLFDGDDHLIALKATQSHWFAGLSSGWQNNYSLEIAGYVASSGIFVADSQRPSSLGFGTARNTGAVLNMPDGDVSPPVLGPDGTYSVVFRDYGSATTAYKLLQYGWW